MKSNFTFLLLFYFLGLKPSPGQELKSIDSLTLFTINEDQMARNQGLQQSKGYVASILPTAEGYQINVFKQYFGYLAFDKATTPKGLSSNKQSLPGLAQITYSAAGLQTQKEKIFSLTRNMAQPFAYKFWEITSLRGGVSTASKNILSDDETAGDYARLLSSQPQVLNFGGVNKTLGLLHRPTNKQVEYFQQPVVFEPYIGRYGEDISKKTTSQKITMQVDSKIPLSFQTRDNTIIYVKPFQKGELITMRIDSTLKESQAEKHSIPADFGLLALAEGRKQTSKEVFGFDAALERDGFALLLGNAATDRKNGNKYLLARFDSDGKLMYRHEFENQGEEYVYSEAKLMVNDQETVLKLTVRKGLKFQLYYLKFTAKGIQYHTQWERSHEKTLKVYTANDKYEAGGSHEDSFVISLPDGSSLLYGADFGMGTGGPLKGYGFTQLGADGKIVAYFNANTLMPPNMPIKGLDFKVLHLGNGKIVLIAKEPRDNSAMGLQKYSVLEREFSETHNLIAKNAPELSINLEKTVQDQIKTGSKLLDKVANAALNGVSTDLGDNKNPSPTETDPVAYATALYFIDTQNPSVKRINLNWKGGYNLPNIEHIWVNTKSREIDAFLRIPERPLDLRKNAPQFPRGVMLQAVKVGY